MTHTTDRTVLRPDFETAAQVRRHVLAHGADYAFTVRGYEMPLSGAQRFQVTATDPALRPRVHGGLDRLLEGTNASTHDATAAIVRAVG